MSRVPVQVLPEVESDLRATAEFYQSWRADGEEHLRKLWREAAEQISQTPEAFPTRYRLFRRHMLRASYYGVFYICEPDAVLILAVLDLRQRPARVRRLLRDRS